MQNAPIKQEREMVYVMANGDEMKLSIATVKKYLVQGHSDMVTDQEVLYFMHECKARKLNPFLRQCWLIKYSQRDNAQIVESIHHKRAKARAAVDCKGWSKGLILQDEKGVLRRSKGLVLKGWAVVGAYFEAQPEGWAVPYELEINLNGYIQRKQNGEITKFWGKENQPTMLMKVVESQGLSALWGETIGTAYIPEELPSVDMEPGENGQYKSAQTKIDELKNPTFDPELEIESDVANAILERRAESASKVTGLPGDPDKAVEEAAKMRIAKEKEDAVRRSEDAGKPEDFETNWEGVLPDDMPAGPPLWKEENYKGRRTGNGSTTGLAGWVNRNPHVLAKAPNEELAKILTKWATYYKAPFPTLEPEDETQKTAQGASEPQGPHPHGLDEPPPWEPTVTEPEATGISNGHTGFQEIDEAIAALGPEIYAQAKEETGFKDGAHTTEMAKVIANRMSRIAEWSNTERGL